MPWGPSFSQLDGVDLKTNSITVSGIDLVDGTPVRSKLFNSKKVGLVCVEWYPKWFALLGISVVGVGPPKL